MLGRAHLLPAWAGREYPAPFRSNISHRTATAPHLFRHLTHVKEAMLQDLNMMGRVARSDTNPQNRGAQRKVYTRSAWRVVDHGSGVAGATSHHDVQAFMHSGAENRKYIMKNDLPSALHGSRSRSSLAAIHPRLTRMAPHFEQSRIMQSCTDASL